MELEDFQGESGKLGGDGFHYFLPAYLLMAEREREEDGDTMLLHEVVSHFTVSDSDPMERLACAKQHAGRLTQCATGCAAAPRHAPGERGPDAAGHLEGIPTSRRGRGCAAVLTGGGARESQEICARLLAAGRQ